MESSQVVISDVKALETKFAATIDCCKRVESTISVMKQWSVSFAEIKKKGKKVQSFCVLAGAKDKCNELGLKVAEVCREFGVCAPQLPAKLNELRAEAWALKEKIDVAKAPPPVRVKTNGWRPRGPRPPRRFPDAGLAAQAPRNASGETSKYQGGVGIYSRWAENFTVLAGMVPAGKESVSSERRIARSEDGEQIVTCWTSGKQEAMKRTVIEQPHATITTIDAKYSVVGSTVEMVAEKETTITFKETAPSATHFIASRTLLTSTEPRLSTDDWASFIDKFVRVDPNALAFTIGKNDYQINEHRIIPIARGEIIAHCIENGRIVPPFLFEMAGKLAYIQRNPDNTFEAVVEFNLPCIVANVDFFVPEETTEAPPARNGRSPEAQRFREQAIAQA